MLTAVNTVYRPFRFVDQRVPVRSAGFIQPLVGDHQVISNAVKAFYAVKAVQLAFFTEHDRFLVCLPVLACRSTYSRLISPSASIVVVVTSGVALAVGYQVANYDSDNQIHQITRGKSHAMPPSSKYPPNKGK